MRTSTQKLLFGGASRLTEVFPVAGARLLDATLRPVLSSTAIQGRFDRRNLKIMRRVKAFRRFLVIPDIHIGDAVLTQPALTAVRDFFPDAQIDYVINKGMAALIEGNPEATRVLPLFTGGVYPSPEDVAGLRSVIRTGGYDLCISFSSLLDPDEQADPTQPFVDIMSRASTIIRNDGDPVRVNHFSYQDYLFVRGVLCMVARPVREESYRGTRITLSDEAVEGAARFTAESGVPSGAPLVMFNPDGGSPFTILPFEGQVALVARIAREAPADTAILIGAGHSSAGIGQRVADALPDGLRDTVRIIPPTVPLTVYAALIDRADVFVTGDTGPLHLAAARKFSRSGAHRLRNRTAIVSFFGATMPRMSGYDSSQVGYLPANQDAPSWCFHAASRCHNITCLNKLYKTCRVVRCFERLDVSALSTVVVTHLATLPGHSREPRLASGRPTA